MDVLLVGADNPVGVALQGAFTQWGRHQSIPTSTAASRWKSERQAKKAARRGKPQVVVDLRLAWQIAAGEIPLPVDIERSHWLAKACERSGMCYIMLSSDRVFSGKLSRSLRTSDPCDAQTPEGLLLVEAERRVLDAAPSAIVLRCGPLFAGFDSNMLTGLLQQMEPERGIFCDDIHTFCPVASVDAARVIAAVLDQFSVGAEASGIYHYCSGDKTTEYGFAEVVLAAASQHHDCGDVLLHADRHGKAQAASRASDSTPDRDELAPEQRSLDCSRLRDAFAVKQVAWRGFINTLVKQYYLRFQEAD
ncbi:MAG: dTDP-4-dehydrorhamnose reductase [Halieaceae bacterium]|jgi:dTDP-4-dehydrorhamnose reductase